MFLFVRIGTILKRKVQQIGFSEITVKIEILPKCLLMSVRQLKIIKRRLVLSPI